MTVTSPSVDTPSNLRQRILAAGTWSIFGFGASQAIRLASNLIMTRILLPEMFGLMAVAMVIMVGITMSFDLGLRQSVVRSKHGCEPRFLNTVWMLQIGRGFLIAAIGMVAGALLLAGIRLELTPVSTIYSDPQLPSVLVALSIGAAIGGFESTKQLEATRNLQLGRLTQIELFCQVTALGVMFAWTAFDRSVWALVAGYIAWITLRVVLTHAILRGISNAFRWDREAFTEVINIGKWIFPSSIVGFIANHADRLLIGAFVSPTVLGLYAIAFFVMNAVEQVGAKVIGEVLFPGLSQIARERPDLLRSAYYKARFALGVPLTFGAGALIVVAQPVIDFLYDARYSDAGWMLQILAVCLVTVQFHLATQCFVALGKARPLLNLALIRAVAVLLLVPLAFSLSGLQGALWGLVLSYFSWIPAAFFYKRQMGLLLPWKEVVLIPAFVLGCLTGLALRFVQGN